MAQQQKTILVTGAKRGIGLGLVKELANDPAISHIFATSREADAPSLKELTQKHKGKVFAIQMDPQDLNSAKKAAEEVKKILNGKGLDYLVNNAGNAIADPSPLEATDENFLNMFHANVLTAQHTTVAFFDLVKLSSTKKVVNISSLVGSISETDGRYPFPTPAYSTSKAALNMLTRFWAKEYAKDGFTFLALSPGYVKTDLSPNATLTTEESAKGIIKVLYAASDPNILYSYDGTHHQW